MERMKDRWQISDAKLIAALNSGSAEAFSALYDRYSDLVYGFAKSMLDDASSARDILQICFMRLWERRGSFNPQGNIPAWLYVVARNEVYKILRHSLFENLADTYALEAVDYEGGGQGADYGLLQSKIKETVEAMPPSMRQVFRMKIGQQMSVTQIAKALKISEKTVYSQLARARKLLREGLSDLFSIIFFALVGN